MTTNRFQLQEVVDYLIEKVEQRELTFYQEVSDHLSVFNSNVEDILLEVEVLLLDKDCPPLTAIVVCKETKYPKDRFMNHLFPKDNKNEKIIKWRKAVKEVFNYDWSNFKL